MFSPVKDDRLERLGGQWGREYAAFMRELGTHFSPGTATPGGEGGLSHDAVFTMHSAIVAFVAFSAHKIYASCCLRFN